MEPVLVVDEHEGGLRACLVPGDEDTEDCCVRLANDGRRCEVTRCTPSHRRLRRIIPVDGLALPAASPDAAAGCGLRLRLRGPHPGGNLGRRGRHSPLGAGRRRSGEFQARDLRRDPGRTACESPQGPGVLAVRQAFEVDRVDAEGESAAVRAAQTTWASNGASSISSSRLRASAMS